MAKIYGRWGAYEARTPEEKSRARRQEQKRQAARASLGAWLEKHKTCANGCGRPVAFYDTIHYALKYSGCCSPECESAMQANHPE